MGCALELLFAFLLGRQQCHKRPYIKPTRYLRLKHERKNERERERERERDRERETVSFLLCSGVMSRCGRTCFPSCLLWWLEWSNLDWGSSMRRFWGSDVDHALSICSQLNGLSAELRGVERLRKLLFHSTLPLSREWDREKKRERDRKKEI